MVAQGHGGPCRSRLGSLGHGAEETGKRVDYVPYIRSTFPLVYFCIHNQLLMSYISEGSRLSAQVLWPTGESRSYTVNCAFLRNDGGGNSICNKFPLMLQDWNAGGEAMLIISELVQSFDWLCTKFEFLDTSYLTSAYAYPCLCYKRLRYYRRFSTFKAVSPQKYCTIVKQGSGSWWEKNTARGSSYPATQGLLPTWFWICSTVDLSFTLVILYCLKKEWFDLLVEVGAYV